MMLRIPPASGKTELDQLYERYNSRKWVHPDPLEFLYHYTGQRDREVAGLVASSLAYGRVNQILRSVGQVMEVLGPSPYHFLTHTSEKHLKRTFSDFRHRFTTGEELALMLWGIKRVIQRYGSLYNCFLSHFRPDHEGVLLALSFFVKDLTHPFKGVTNSLLPSPEKGSACKRLHLFLRWMVRQDRVDPGGWGEVPPSKLAVPLDTHMYRISRSLGLTRRKTADVRTVMEVTRGFRRWAPEDPVRYDFALTRHSMRSGV